jgi:predicted phage-related endonuclease
VPIHKHGLYLVPTTGMSRIEWLNRRQDGLGGSDISAILGLNEHFSAIDLYYQKVGLTFKPSEEVNEAMHWGNKNENNVLQSGQYYDFETGTYVESEVADIKLRQIDKFPYMVINPKYNWIIGNLDGAVDLDAEKFLMQCIAEAKTISRQTAEKWENRIIPYHVVQITAYATICRPITSGDWAMIFYLEDGRTFRGHLMPVVETLREQILEASYNFWKQVLKGKEIVQNTPDEDKARQFLSEFEPEPDKTRAYEAFISELHAKKKEFIRLQGDDTLYTIAREYEAADKQMKELTVDKQWARNRLLHAMHKAGANVIDFGDSIGRVTYNKKFYCNLK